VNGLADWSNTQNRQNARKLHGFLEGSRSGVQAVHFRNLVRNPAYLAEGQVGVGVGVETDPRVQRVHSRARRHIALHCIASRLWPGEEGFEPLCHTPAARELNWMRTRPRTLTDVRQVWSTGEQGGEAAQVENLAWLPGFSERQ
jgi:hypothetical protein